MKAFKGVYFTVSLLITQSVLSAFGNSDAVKVVPSDVVQAEAKKGIALEKTCSHCSDSCMKNSSLVK
jgi:flavoprotein